MISASTVAPRSSACSSDSNTTAPAPSPATNPARRTSNGREACVGSSAFDSAPRFENPARQMGDTDSSEPPASAASM